MREEAKKLADHLAVHEGRLERLMHDELLPQLGGAARADIDAKAGLAKALLENVTINVSPVRAPEQLRDFNKAMAELDQQREQLGAAGAAADVPRVERVLGQIRINAAATEPEPTGPVNFKYQSVVLGCTKVRGVLRCAGRAAHTATRAGRRTTRSS